LYRRRWIAAFLLTLLVVAGAHEFWQRTALRDRPWQLESYVDILEAECRTGPGSYVFGRELRALTALVNDAKLCLTAQHGTWAVSRDYTPCVGNLLRAAEAALRIRMNQSARLKESETRFQYYLKNLEWELARNAVTTRTGAQFEIRNLSHSRARTLAEQARNLAKLGQIDSAMVAVLGARAAWGQNKDFQAVELARFYDPALKARWEKDTQDLLRWTRRTGRSAILVDKLEHRCYLLTAGRIEKSYVANLGRNWYRNKMQEHDASTPEGEYTVRRKFRSSRFNWALLLNYPNADDQQRFNSLKKAGGIAANARIGGNIEIHGGGRLNSDWTDGCVSLENDDMAELYRRSYAGMPVTIVGTSALGASARN